LVTVTPESCDPMNEDEPITYIFKAPDGRIVKKHDGSYHEFTIDKAKRYAKCFTNFEIRQVNEVKWHSCATYFEHPLYQ